MLYKQKETAKVWHWNVRKIEHTNHFFRRLESNIYRPPYAPPYLSSFTCNNPGSHQTRTDTPYQSLHAVVSSGVKPWFDAFVGARGLEKDGDNKMGVYHCYWTGYEYRFDSVQIPLWPRRIGAAAPSSATKRWFLKLVYSVYPGQHVQRTTEHFPYFRQIVEWQLLGHAPCPCQPIDQVHPIYDQIDDVLSRTTW